MFNTQRPVSHWPKLRPYGKTKQPEFHPRKPFPAPPPTPYNLQGVRRAHVQMHNENAAPPPTVPRHRRPRSEGTDYPPRSEWKNMRYLAAPPPRRGAPPRLVGDQIYIDVADEAQPIIDEIKAQGPLNERAQRVLQQVSQYRFEAMVRANYHKEAVIVEEVMANAPPPVRRMPPPEFAAARQPPLDEAAQLAADVKGELLRRELRMRRQARKREEKERKERQEAKAARAAREEFFQHNVALRLREQNERIQREMEMEARQRQEREEAERKANEARTMEERWQKMKRIQAQREQMENMQRRWRVIEEARAQEMREQEERQRKEAQERRRREQEERYVRQQEEAARRAQEEQERKRREEQERAAREAEEAARRAQEEQERNAREQWERQAQEANTQWGRTICRLYEVKWQKLKEEPVKDVRFFEFPFPIAAETCDDPSDITLERVREFLFWPQRPDCEGKTKREILKIEVLRWHPDKFESRVGPKVLPADWKRTKEAAELVARWVTTLMAEA
ncbi:Reticulocyte-binding protein 2 -like protein [Trametes pubescens]|uniref:Reticulocyte-binding protein 2-like protein n=1 Tax=Trametes pubescens TaxID=154538 RepID=A0A1M2VSP1_TRAPU|nr:Reticulocyte-binding protein 2 -like protein [Trametes pubescens]